MKKIVAFIGSPRKKGNTSTIVEEIARGAKEAGAEVKVYYLNDMTIKPCQSCFYCRQVENCATKDDMQSVYADIKDAGAIVIGSPIYMAQVTAQTKLLLDRLFPIIDANFKPRFGVKKTVLVYSQGQGEDEAFRGYLEYNANVLKLLGLDIVDTIMCTGANDPQTAAKNESLMAKAFKTGKELVE
ncbi:NAD(P)H dehydrogenase (quinone) [Moorella thermoacetica]|uniref:NAD(P)H dehydrogenase (Quinone) n=1 Tax=Neomoorella thermoacetica TaxID=1525 RepID=A0A1J5N6Z3_NEOTH|nr:NAD(P)H dehydrogenase (quinone) [Moorella thermoacetica]